jgi:heme-degrading monooxygenase HmoA
MFIAMNRFQVHPGREADFERLWLNRETHLQGMPGFIEFQLLRGPSQDDHTLFASHTVWASREAFESWTRSQAFRDAHKNAGDHRGLYLGHPHFEGFEVLQSLAPAN